MKTLFEVIQQSQIARANALGDGECHALANEVAEWLESLAVSAESLFDIDKGEDEQEEVIPLKAIILNQRK